MGRRAIPGFIVLAMVAGSAAADENPIVTLVKGKGKDPAKPFAMAVILKVKAGEEKAFEAAFAPALTATRKEPGCVAYILNRDVEKPNHYVMYESFKSIAALEEHAKTPYVEKLLSTIMPMLEEKPEVKVYTIAGE